VFQALFEEQHFQLFDHDQNLVLILIEMMNNPNIFLYEFFDFPQLNSDIAVKEEEKDED
jgi:hypothetical protein